MLQQEMKAKEDAQKNVQTATAKLAAAKKQADEEQRLRNKELEAVNVSKDDIEYLSRELKISTKEATLKLRENGGNLRKTIEVLVA